MHIFLKTIKSDNESDTTELVDNLCDPFAATIRSRNSEKNIIRVERLFNCWIDSLQENRNVTKNFNWILSLRFEQRNWGPNKLEYSSGKPSAIWAQPRLWALIALGFQELYSNIYLEQTYHLSNAFAEKMKTKQQKQKSSCRRWKTICSQISKIFQHLFLNWLKAVWNMSRLLTTRFSLILLLQRD